MLIVFTNKLSTEFKTVMHYGTYGGYLISFSVVVNILRYLISTDTRVFLKTNEPCPPRENVAYFL